MALTVEKIWRRYNTGTGYLENNNVFETVKRNEDFFEGNQWSNQLVGSSMPTPVLNVLQRAGKFMVATIGTNDIAVSMVPFSQNPADSQLIAPIKAEIEHIIEQAKIKEKSKEMIREAFIEGSSYLLFTFNPYFDTKQPMKGRIECERVDITNVRYGNPYTSDIHNQPYIIISMRQDKHMVKREAKKYGLSEEEIELIKPDNDGLHANDDSDNLVTVLLYFWKDEETETVHFTKSTEKVFLIEDTDLGYELYPLSCFGWDPKKNSYLYISPMTANIENQVFINKSFAIAQMYGLQSAFPKVLFDKSKVDIDEFLNSTDPQAVAGMDLAGKFIDFIKIPDFSNNIIDLARETISQTKEMMGVTDASLGNVKADNTSAIIQLQTSSAVPLEIQKQQYFEMWEESVRIIIDMMSCTYGKRNVMYDDNQMAEVNFSDLKHLNYNLTVEIGNGAQFSEITQINTLDKLVQAGYITPDVYMDVIPSKYLPQKARLIESYKSIMQSGMTPQSRGSTELDENTPL